MNGPFVRAGQGGNAPLTSTANYRLNQLQGEAERLVASALSAQHQLNTPLVIWNLQVL
ncbi:MULTISPECIES: hypothetical protein [Pseudomonadaceae]|jgi:hypothetical protein|uniref:Uncharacterized protein n=1 Tax=Stutzerimonas zhaodongensis TaxID=1176257 RepID=A0ABX8ISU7_9GAMM|nr:MULTISPECIES: hypothetical protein [Pseudomonadaceae]MBU0949397.1 hypothetical protein [Gammaproteobacteria bacterium]QWV16730.1 hypothetical protein KQ248_20085 [Stutzerimonas zhaodongensis]